MGCFLGCFGGDKEQKRRKKRVNRASPQRQRNRVQNVQQEIKITAEQSITETTPINLVSESLNEPEVVEQLSRSPKKRVTFNSNVTTTTYEHVSVHESIDSLPECPTNIEKEKKEISKASSQSHSNSEDDNSITSSVASYPPNHRYHNARDSDDEAEEFGDSDLDDDLDDDYDEEDYEDDYDEEDHDVRIAGQEVWSESVVTTSMESRTGNPSSATLDQEVESPMIKSELSDEEIKAFGSKTNTRDRSDYINSVLNPVENITQWKAVKSRGTSNHLKPQKENLTENLDPPRISFTSEPIFKKKTDLSQKNENQEISVDASLSNWLGSPEIIKPTKKMSFSGFETTSEGCNSVRSFEDRPILGALTVEELRQMSAASASPRKSPSRSPDEMPIIGTVGSYWNHSDSAKPVSSFKGIPNTTSKYREDKRVNWHSTPFETRLDRALHRGDAEA